MMWQYFFVLLGLAFLTNEFAVADRRRERNNYEGDLMVVLPVTQGNPESFMSNIQKIFTKAPVTEIIGQSFRKNFQNHSPRFTPPIMKRTDNFSPLLNLDNINQERHPYTEFLAVKPSMTAKSTKSPLDYGYPESFKFVQELNEMPKNHKPDWLMVDKQEFVSDSDVSKTFSTTERNFNSKGDPFQMFESVKPLEVNKLLSLKPVVISVSDSIAEDFTKSKEDSNDFQPMKRPLEKRPTKKPQKSKPNPQRLNEEDLLLLTTIKTTVTPASISHSNNDLEYTAVKYSTLLAQSTNNFTPSNRPFKPVATIIRHIIPPTTPTTTTTTTTTATSTTLMLTTAPTTNSSIVTIANTPITTTPTTTTTNPSTTISISSTLTPNLKWANSVSKEITRENSEPATTPKGISEIKPSDLVSLTKLLGENLDSKIRESSTKAPVTSENTVSPEVKNLLIAMGILKSGEDSVTSPRSTTVTTTTRNNFYNLFSNHESISPTVDPQSYVNFKKIPIDARNQDLLPVSDDMKDFLAAFGLLPKRNGYKTLRNSVLTRISRHQNFQDNDMNATQSEVQETVLMPEDLQNTLENLGLLKPLALISQSHKNGHVFQPSMHLEKLGDEQKVRKISETIEYIRKLSKSKEIGNLTLEEIEKQLENVTSIFQDETSNSEQLNEVIGNATASKIVETIGKIPLGSPEENDDDFIVHYSPDESAISVVNLTSSGEDEFSESISSIGIDADSISSTGISTDSSSSTEPESIDDFHVSLEPNPTSELNLTLNSNSSSEINIVMEPPNPLSPEELDLLVELNKNEVKRQQPDNSSSTSTSTTELDSTTIASTSSFNTSSSFSATSETETATQPESNNPPVSDLAESFGTAETVSEGPPAVDETSTQRPNGLYFYVDWNTFLNVGEPDRSPIRIRFAPRAGNSRNFLPITVP